MWKEKKKQQQKTKKETNIKSWTRKAKEENKRKDLKMNFGKDPHGAKGKISYVRQGKERKLWPQSYSSWPRQLVTHHRADRRRVKVPWQWDKNENYWCSFNRMWDKKGIDGLVKLCWTDFINIFIYIFFKSRINVAFPEQIKCRGKLIKNYYVFRVRFFQLLLLPVLVTLSLFVGLKVGRVQCGGRNPISLFVLRYFTLERTDSVIIWRKSNVLSQFFCSRKRVCQCFMIYA